MLTPRYLAILSVALIFCAAPIAKAPDGKEASRVKVSETVEYYDIGGASVPALWHNISTHGPRSGKTAWAGHARWDVSWVFDWRATETGCQIEEISTSLAVTYTLPRWSGRNLADQELRDKWDRFSLALRLHEEGHGANGRRAAERINATLEQLGPRPTCNALSLAAEEAARRVIDEEALNDRLYDNTTLHGLKQGVVLR